MLPTESEVDLIVRSARARLKRLEGQGRLPDQLPKPKAKRAHGKRHSVNRERSREDRAKARRAKGHAEANLAERQRRAEVVRRYFAGELADLSAL